MTDLERLDTIDPVWEQKYSEGHAQRYPWDSVVSFVFRHAPRDRPWSEVRILELGFGTGSNLWFAAREGFSVAGIEGSASAVEAARRRFEEDGLEGDLRLGQFPDLPFEAASVDLAIDRAAITCVGLDVARSTLRSVHRVLRTGGIFFFNTYSAEHASASSGRLGEDGRVHGIQAGTIQGFGPICFYDEPRVREVLGSGWNILEWMHVVQTDAARSDGCHAEWRIMVEKSA